MSSVGTQHPEEGLLLRYLDGELPSRKTRQVELHLKACWQCRTEVEELQGVIGDCVIVGRGAAHILPKETTLRVRLVGNLDDRIAAICRRMALTKEKAAKWLADTDHQRQTFVKDHFLKDPSDSHNYDLVLNTSSERLRRPDPPLPARLRKPQIR